MISDVLWEAEQQIKEYLSWENNPYGEPGEPFRDRIDALLREMEGIRMQPGMDLPPTAVAYVRATPGSSPETLEDQIKAIEKYVGSDVPIKLEFSEAEALLAFLMDQINGGRVFDEKLRHLQRVRDKLSAQRQKTVARDS